MPHTTLFRIARLALCAGTLLLGSVGLASAKRCDPAIESTLTLRQATAMRNAFYACSAQGKWLAAKWTGKAGCSGGECFLDLSFVDGTSEDRVLLARIVSPAQIRSHPDGREIIEESEERFRRSIQASDLSQDAAWGSMKQGLLEGHEELRRDYQQSVSKLPRLYAEIGGDQYGTTVEWNDDLARGAQAWANRLAAEAVEALRAHEEAPMYHGDDAGWENIAGHIYDAQDPGRSARDAVSGSGSGAWGGEKQFVIFRDDAAIGACQPGEECGHYNTITSVRMARVGCGAAVVVSPYRAASPTSYWVCRYGGP